MSRKIAARGDPASLSPGLNPRQWRNPIAQAKAKNITHSDALNADGLIVLYDAYVAAAAALLGIANQPRAACSAADFIQGESPPTLVPLAPSHPPQTDRHSCQQLS